MYSIEFKTSVENGLIEIPNQYKHEFEQQKNVKVILIKQVEVSEAKNLLEQILDNPIYIEAFTPLKRDEIYEL